MGHLPKAAHTHGRQNLEAKPRSDSQDSVQSEHVPEGPLQRLIWADQLPTQLTQGKDVSSKASNKKTRTGA